MTCKSLCVAVLTALCAFFIVAGSATASDGFRIEDYIPQKFTDLEWKIGGNYRFSHNDQDHNYSLPTSGYTSIIEDRTGRSNYLFGESEINYRNETTKQVFSLGCTVWGDYSRTKDNRSHNSIRTSQIDVRSSRNVSESSEKTYGFSVAPSFDIRSYLESDLFVGVSGHVWFDIDEIPKLDDTVHVLYSNAQNDYVVVSERSSQRERDSHTRNRYISLSVGPGWGRVYEGHFAATSLYIVDELRREGIVEREPTAKEMLDLTEIIYQQRSTHEVDHRLAKIDALNELMTFLIQSGIIGDTGHYGYLLIQDVYDYYPKHSRSFGSWIGLGVGWDYNYVKTEESWDDRSMRFIYRYHVDSPTVIDTGSIIHEEDSGKETTRTEVDNTFIYMQAKYHRPISMCWQLDATADLRYYVAAEGLKKTSLNPPFTRTRGVIHRLVPARELEDYYQLLLDLQGTWIYSSRTSFEAKSALMYDHHNLIPIGDRDSWENHRLWDWRLTAGMTYRIAIPTTLRVSLQHLKRHDSTGDNWPPSLNTRSWSFSASISHYLF